MKASIGRYIAGLTTATLILSGCGGSQSQESGPGIVPPSAAQPAHALTSAASGDLIYATGGCGGICVLSYPHGQIVANIQLKNGVGGPCSDNAGNVFVPNETQVLEYQHGGTSPVATLSLPGYAASGCSVDPTTGNLAVTFLDPSAGTLAIFAKGSGSPTVYAPPLDTFYCGYDDAGNLFVSGVSNNEPALSELPNGQSTFTTLSISGKLGAPGQLQWDGSYLAYQSRALKGQKGSISQLTVSGANATVVSTTPLNGKINSTSLSWIYNGRVLVPYSTRGARVNKIGLWSYPQGGSRNSTIKFKNAKSWLLVGLTVSITSKRHNTN